MKAREIAELVRVSRAVGSRRELVQGGGGNASVKSRDGKTIAVKASGTPLAEMSKAAGWVELDMKAVLAVLDNAALRRLRPSEREAEVLRLLTAAVVGGPPGRPSVETALHALLGKVVIHTHPASVNALTCGPGANALRDLVRPGELPPLWVPYTDPGYTLAAAVRRAVAAYRRKHRAPPQVLLLENHGIFASGDTAPECLALHDSWTRRCDEYFEKTAPGLAPEPRVESAALRAAMAVMRRAWTEATGRPAFVRLSIEPELMNAAASDHLARVLARGALSPDQIVYAGARSILAGSVDEAAAAVRRLCRRPGGPRLALVRGLGAFVLSDDPARLDVTEAVAVNAAATVRLAAGRGGAHNLAPAHAHFIMNWEVELYRSKLLDRPHALLSGRVAVVTGAASGLGLGIAHGLIDAGAAVAFTDIDDPALEAAVNAAANPARALAVHMDVTSEKNVATAFDRIVRHWGGLDILVCAAGIAPAYPLVDTPLDKWRLALEINLTGYFLAAREAARILKAQRQGGSFVLISSKTGLEPSIANSAYNATKAAELHLMRGWALELGPDAVRVNAVAPGNVFDGSKIWNPEYIKVCARKRGIKPEEVIPYYIGLTALKREIKRPDVAAAVVFLCSDHARCITGQTLVVDSGQVFVR